MVMSTARVIARCPQAVLFMSMTKGFAFSVKTDSNGTNNQGGQENILWRVQRLARTVMDRARGIA